MTPPGSAAPEGAHTCRHCKRRIVSDDGRWVDPEATGDDSVWRETCDAHDTFTAEHEPLTDEDTAPTPPIVATWADGFGVWHVRVSRGVGLLAARQGLRGEVEAREKFAARNVWLHPIRVPELDTPDTVVYREGTAE